MNEQDAGAKKKKKNSRRLWGETSLVDGYMYGSANNTWMYPIIRVIMALRLNSRTKLVVMFGS